MPAAADEESIEDRGKRRRRGSRRAKDDSRRRTDDSDSSVDDDRRRRHSRRHKRRHSRHSTRSASEDSEVKERDSKRSKRSKHGRKESRRKVDDREDRRRSSKDRKRKHDEGTKQKVDDRKHMRKDDSRRKHLVDLGRVTRQPPDNLLDAEKDYFTYHQHFWVYLFREEGAVFNDLTSEEAHEAFKRFVKKFNKGDLEEAYYDAKGMPPRALEECKTTQHAWSFKTSAIEEQNLNALQQGVRKQTEFQAADETSMPETKLLESKVNTINTAAEHDKEVAPKQANDRGRQSFGKRQREQVRASAEEYGISDKPDPGRDRQMAQRGQVAARTHGASRDKDAAGIELSTNDLYGESDRISFQAALAREKAHKAKREEQKRDRVAQLQREDQNRKQALLDQLGLSGMKPGDKITIAPRKD